MEVFSSYLELTLFIFNSSYFVCFSLYISWHSFSQVSGNPWLSNILRVKHQKADWKLLARGKDFSVASGNLIWKISQEIVAWCPIFKINRFFSPWDDKFLWENFLISCLKERILPTSWEQNKEKAVSVMGWKIVLQLIPISVLLPEPGSTQCAWIQFLGFSISIE